MRRRLILLVTLVASLCTPIGAPATFGQTDADDQARIQLLEDQVLQLNAEVRRMRQKLVELQNLMADASRMLKDANIAATTVNPAAANPNPECGPRRADLVRRRDQLREAGFKDSHPDIKNITSIIAKIDQDCAQTAQQPQAVSN